MELPEKIIDVGKALRGSQSPFLRSLPGIVIRGIEKFVWQDGMNATIHRSRELEGVPFINDVLEGWKVKIITKGDENMPSAGRFVFVANHPLGAIDALSVFSTVYRFFPDMISPSNELLNYIPNLRPVMLGINVFGKNSKETAEKLNELFESETQVIIFPSGEVSRRKKGKIEDPVWQKTFITKAIQYKRDIVPLFVSGRNSNLFYNVANLRKFLGIKMYVETILLPREMRKQRNSTVNIAIGKVIPWQTFTEDKNLREWAQVVKEIVYNLNPG